MVRITFKINPYSLDLWRKCEYKFMFYAMGVEPLPKPLSEPLLIGSDIHDLIREYYQMLMKNDYNFTYTDVRMLLKDLVEKRKLVDLNSDYDDFETSRIRTLIENFARFEVARIEKLGDGKIKYLEEKLSKIIRVGNVSIIVDGVIDVAFNFFGKVIGFDWKTGLTSVRLDKPFIEQGTIYKFIGNLDDFYFIFLSKGKTIRLGDEYNFEDVVLPTIKEIVSKFSNKDLEQNLEHCEECVYNVPCKIFCENITLEVI